MFACVKGLAIFGCMLACGCVAKAPNLPEHEPIHQELKLHSLDGPVPEVMTLYSLDGHYYPGTEEAVIEITPETEFFHDWPVLGKKSISDASERHELWDALNKGIEESDGVPAACFWPHHGLRIDRDGVQSDYLICFHCSQIEIYAGDKKETALTSDSAKPVFNPILKAAGIPVSRGGE